MSPNGTGLPFTFDDEQNCKGMHYPQDDGYYTYSELHYTVWLAFNRACSGGDGAALSQSGVRCTAALKNMWARWQGRRFHPPLSYHQYKLLTFWPSYIVQLPFYAAHSFNSDSHWEALFRSHWAADWLYYNSSAYYGGDDGRYGLAAGPTDRWCSAKDSGYEADYLAGDHSAAGAQGCRLYSPFAVAGYLPASPAQVRSHLLRLLSAGESVMRLEGEREFAVGDFVLLRKSMIEPGWNQETHVTMVDFASELFGLSTLWLGVDFYRNNTAHNWTYLNSA